MSEGIITHSSLHNIKKVAGRESKRELQSGWKELSQRHQAHQAEENEDRDACTCICANNDKL